MVRKSSATVSKSKEKAKPRNSRSGSQAVRSSSAPAEGARAARSSNAAGLEMRRVCDEVLRLVEASRQGRLEERGNPGQFQGAHREMVQGINEMLDAILLPIGEGNRILAQISGGKIDELIAHTYQGDHEKMKVAVNNVGGVVQALQKELMRLTDASRDGQLSERGRPTSSAAPMPTSSAVSMPCWMQFSCPSAKATASWARSPTARSTS